MWSEVYVAAMKLRSALTRIVEWKWRAGLGKRAGKVHVRVNVWGSLVDLRASRRERFFGVSNTAVAYWCVPEEVFRFDKKGRTIRGPFLGEVNFCLEASDAGTVAHECFHAVMCLARRLKVNPARAARKEDRQLEEFFAEAHTELMNQCDRLLEEVRAKHRKMKKDMRRNGQAEPLLGGVVDGKFPPLDGVLKSRNVRGGVTRI